MEPAYMFVLRQRAGECSYVLAGQIKLLGAFVAHTYGTRAHEPVS